MRNQNTAKNGFGWRSESSLGYFHTTMTVPRRGFTSVMGMTEVLLVGCVITGLLIMAPAMRPILCPINNENVHSAEQFVPHLVVAHLCNEAWYQSGQARLLRYDSSEQQNELAYIAPDDSIIKCWNVSDDGCTLLVSTLNQAVESNHLLKIYRGEETIVSQDYAQSPFRAPLFDLSADGTSAIAITEDVHARLWNLQLTEPTSCEFSLEVAAKMVRIDGEHNRLVVVTDKGSIQLYDLCAQRLLQTVELPTSDSNPKHSSINRFAVSRNGQLIAVGSIDLVAVFDLSQGAWIWQKQFAEDYSVIELVISGDNRSIAVSGLSAHLFVYDSHSGQCTHEFLPPAEVQSNDVHRIGFAASNDRLYSASFGSTIFEWDLKTLQRKPLNPATPAAIL